MKRDAGINELLQNIERVPLGDFIGNSVLKKAFIKNFHGY